MALEKRGKNQRSSGCASGAKGGAKGASGGVILAHHCDLFPPLAVDPHRLPEFLSLLKYARGRQVQGLSVMNE